MNEPIDGSSRETLRQAFRHLRMNSSFQEILKWIEIERDKRDEENRVIGSENQTSEASALSKILSVYAAATKRDE